ncbi:hypothetical protein ACQ4N7_28780 [Nodosilinea sp. AN01ver1]|uniref:hypothetical protein n=1 Tax=Nodosilinea sp. AN01ver1 TaxID=3423362 RepID=UPI003D316363
MRYTTEQSSTLGQMDSTSTQSISQLVTSLQSRQGLTLLGCVVLIAAFSLMSY